MEFLTLSALSVAAYLAPAHASNFEITPSVSLSYINQNVKGDQYNEGEKFGVDNLSIKTSHHSDLRERNVHWFVHR